MLLIIYFIPAGAFVWYLLYHRDVLSPISIGVYVTLAVLGAVFVLGVLQAPLILFASWMALLALILFFHTKLRTIL